MPKYKNIQVMLRPIDEAGRNFTLARKIYRDLVRNNGTRFHPNEIPNRRNFARLDYQFGEHKIVMQLTTRRNGAGRPRVHWQKEKKSYSSRKSLSTDGVTEHCEKSRNLAHDNAAYNTRRRSATI